MQYIFKINNGTDTLILSTNAVYKLLLLKKKPEKPEKLKKDSFFLITEKHVILKILKTQQIEHSTLIRRIWRRQICNIQQKIFQQHPSKNTKPSYLKKSKQSSGE